MDPRPLGRRNQRDKRHFLHHPRHLALQRMEASKQYPTCHTAATTWGRAQEGGDRNQSSRPLPLAARAQCENLWNDLRLLVYLGCGVGMEARVPPPQWLREAHLPACAPSCSTRTMSYMRCATYSPAHGILFWEEAVVAIRAVRVDGKFVSLLCVICQVYRYILKRERPVPCCENLNHLHFALGPKLLG